MDDLFFETCLRHEASHAAVQEALGGRWCRIWVEQTGPVWEGHTQVSKLPDRLAAVMLLAGPLSELQRSLGLEEAMDELRSMAEDAPDDDEGRALALVGERGFARAARWAWRLLGQRKVQARVADLCDQLRAHPRHHLQDWSWLTWSAAT